MQCRSAAAAAYAHAGSTRTVRHTEISSPVNMSVSRVQYA